jgi:hypothetical protein
MRITLEQVCIIAFIMALPAAVWSLLLALSPDYSMMLLRDPRGLKMLIVAIVCQLAAGVAYVLLYALMNSHLGDGRESESRWGPLMYRLAALAILVVFVLPSLFIVLAGPAGIQIVDSLSGIE